MGSKPPNIEKKPAETPGMPIDAAKRRILALLDRGTVRNFTTLLNGVNADAKGTLLRRQVAREALRQLKRERKINNDLEGPFFRINK